MSRWVERSRSNLEIVFEEVNLAGQPTGRTRIAPADGSRPWLAGHRKWLTRIGWFVTGAAATVAVEIGRSVL